MIITLATGNSLVYEWYTQQTGKQVPETCGVIAVLDADVKIIGCVFFVEYTGANIEAHLHLPKCLNRFVIKFVLNYVFNQLKCIRFTVKPPRNKKRVLRNAIKMGFQYETTLKSYYGLTKGDDAIVYVMYKDQAKKWIELDAAS